MQVLFHGRVDRAVHSGDEDARIGAIFTLSNIGSDAEQAIPALILALDDDNTYVSTIAARALDAISDQEFGEDKEAWKKWWNEQQQ